MPHRSASRRTAARSSAPHRSAGPGRSDGSRRAAGASDRRRRAAPAAALAAVLLGAAAAGCGYTWVGRERAPQAQVRVAIQTLENRSAEPGAELVMTDALRRECLSRGALRLVPSTRQADWVVRGKVRPIESRAQSFSSVVLALEHSLTLELELEVESPDGRRIDLSVDSLRETEIYLDSADIEATRKNREEALRRLASLIAVRVHDAIELEAAQPASTPAGTPDAPPGSAAVAQAQPPQAQDPPVENPPTEDVP